MMILEYKLDATLAGMMCPPWIEDGGYWTNPADFTMVGVTGDTPEFHIPSTVLRLTPLQLEDRQVAIHTLYPMLNPFDDEPTEPQTVMTEVEVRAAIQDWVTEQGVTE
jgi:hypothetical protein